MTFMLPDGRALDDAEPQDVPRQFAEVFDKLADRFERGPIPADERVEFAEQMRRAAASMRVWAQFGRWTLPSRVRELERELRDARDREWRGMPGVWLITEEPGHRRELQISRLADVPDPLPLAAIALRLDAIAAAVSRVQLATQVTHRRLADGNCALVHPSPMQVAEAIAGELVKEVPRG